METIIVGIIVGLAAVWSGFRLFGRRKTSACASGCGGCSCPSKSPPPLVTLRR